MAFGEVTGATPVEVEEMREEYQDTPLSKEDDVPFEIAYCLTRIGKQPDDYDGPQRFCKRRVAKKDPEYYEGDNPRSPDAYASSCPSHGGHNALGGRKTAEENLESKTAHLIHGMYAEDENLMMDFTDSEQELFDRIMNEWPDIYNWPSRDEDPARYRILRRIAVNEVRSIRSEDYIDGQEVYEEPVFDDNGVQVGTKEVENPLAREYRLLMSEVTNQMRELGLTPKERQRMDTMESEEDKNDAVADIADEALGGGEYDPGDF